MSRGRPRLRPLASPLRLGEPSPRRGGVLRRSRPAGASAAVTSCSRSVGHRPRPRPRPRPRAPLSRGGRSPGGISIGRGSGAGGARAGGGSPLSLASRLLSVSLEEKSEPELSPDAGEVDRSDWSVIQRLAALSRRILYSWRREHDLRHNPSKTQLLLIYNVWCNTNLAPLRFWDSGTWVNVKYLPYSTFTHAITN